MDAKIYRTRENVGFGVEGSRQDPVCHQQVHFRPMCPLGETR